MNEWTNALYLLYNKTKRCSQECLVFPFFSPIFSNWRNTGIFCFEVLLYLFFTTVCQMWKWSLIFNAYFKMTSLTETSLWWWFILLLLSCIYWAIIVWSLYQLLMSLFFTGLTEKNPPWINMHHFSKMINFNAFI